MSIAAMSAVWDRADADGTLLLLLLAIADHANDEGVAWPSVETLARRIRRSRARTFELLTDAERRGLLTRARGVGGRSNRYRLTEQGPNPRTVRRAGRSESSDGPKDRTSKVRELGRSGSDAPDPNRHRTASEPSEGSDRRLSQSRGRAHADDNGSLSELDNAALEGRLLRERRYLSSRDELIRQAAAKTVGAIEAELAVRDGIADDVPDEQADGTGRRASSNSGGSA